MPTNFKVEEGFEYHDVMTIAIDDFPPMFSYNLTLSVYTINLTLLLERNRLPPRS